MGQVGKIVAGMGLLIGLYLVIHDYSGTVSIINSIANATTGTVKVLQARG